MTLLEAAALIVFVLTLLGIWKAYEILRPNKEWRFRVMNLGPSHILDRKAPNLKHAMRQALTSPLVIDPSFIEKVSYLRGTEWIEVPESAWKSKKAPQ